MIAQPSIPCMRWAAANPNVLNKVIAAGFSMGEMPFSAENKKKTLENFHSALDFFVVIQIKRIRHDAGLQKSATLERFFLLK